MINMTIHIHGGMELDSVVSDAGAGAGAGVGVGGGWTTMVEGAGGGW